MIKKQPIFTAENLVLYTIGNYSIRKSIRHPGNFIIRYKDDDYLMEYEFWPEEKQGSKDENHANTIYDLVDTFCDDVVESGYARRKDIGKIEDDVRRVIGLTVKNRK